MIFNELPVDDYVYETKFLLPDGTVLKNEDDYNMQLLEGMEAYVACFVGCIYHCG